MDNRSNSTRGYTFVVIRALILATTAIFIRFLTKTYGPACAHPGFLAGQFRRSCPSADSWFIEISSVAHYPTPTFNLPARLWIYPRDLQGHVDALGRIERRDARDGSRLLLGWFHRPAGLVVSQRTLGLDQTPGGRVQPQWLRPGRGRTQSVHLARQSGRHPNWHPLGLVLRGTA